MRDLLLYSVLRIVILLGLWWVLQLLGMGPVVALVTAVAVSMMISFLFFRGPRERAARRIQEADLARRERRGPEVDEDADEEDALIDGPRGPRES